MSGFFDERRNEERKSIDGIRRLLDNCNNKTVRIVPRTKLASSEVRANFWHDCVESWNVESWQWHRLYHRICGPIIRFLTGPRLKVVGV